MTYSAPKPVSTLSALADEETRRAIEAAHAATVAAGWDYLQSHTGYSRRGRNGIEQISTAGYAAALFDHGTIVDAPAGTPTALSRSVAGRPDPVGIAVSTALVTVSDDACHSEPVRNDTVRVGEGRGARVRDNANPGESAYERARAPLLGEAVTAVDGRRALPASAAVRNPRRVTCTRRPVSGSRPTETLKYQPPRPSEYTPSGLAGMATTAS